MAFYQTKNYLLVASQSKPPDTIDTESDIVRWCSIRWLVVICIDCDSSSRTGSQECV